MQEKIINRHGRKWRVVSGDRPALIDAAITHAAVTGSTGCTYTDGGESVTVARINEFPTHCNAN